jgi:hypothetical protein
MKWKGRNVTWFTVVHYIPPHIEAKKFLPPSGRGVIRKCLCICVSVGLRKKVPSITLELGGRLDQNLLGPSHSSQIIFGRVTWTQDNSELVPDQEKWVLLEIYLLLEFSTSRACHTISETRGRGQQNVGSRIMIFCPGPEKLARKSRQVWVGS